MLYYAWEGTNNVNEKNSESWKKNNFGMQTMEFLFVSCTNALKWLKQYSTKIVSVLSEKYT